MSEKNEYHQAIDNLIGTGQFRTVFQPKPENEVFHSLAAERRRSDAEMALRFANLTMPDDIRSRAKAWGMESFCEVLWNNAFQAGFREAMRGRDVQKAR